jgi:hypothetical protein
MPNPFHYRAKIDRLRQRSAEHNPGYIRLKALNRIVRELIGPSPQAQLNRQLYLATDPYDVARHKLRDLYDRASPPLPLGEACPVLDTGGWGEGPPAPTDEESSQEDDDPL